MLRDHIAGTESELHITIAAMLRQGSILQALSHMYRMIERMVEFCFLSVSVFNSAAICTKYFAGLDENFSYFMALIMCSSQGNAYHVTLVS